MTINYRSTAAIFLLVLFFASGSNSQAQTISPKPENSGSDQAVVPSSYKRLGSEGVLENLLAWDGHDKFVKFLDVSDENIEALKQTAVNGNSQACFALASLYRDGYHVGRNNKASVEFFNAAIKLGHVEAKVSMAYMHRCALGVEFDPNEETRLYDAAVEEYTIKADKGDVAAQYRIGEIHDKRMGGNRKEIRKLAFSWYRKAAEQGYPKAQCTLGEFYLTGKSPVEEDAEKAVNWYQKAAGHGWAEAQYQLGVCSTNGLGMPVDESAAAQWYQLAAEQGYADAQFNLGTCYRKGAGVKQDAKTAVKWYRSAAKQDHRNAQYNLGACYLTGEGVEVDAIEAAKWFEKAAKQGVATAQFSIGFCYRVGVGVAVDNKRAFKWFLKAANQGNADGQFHLALCYAGGIGVRRNPNQSMIWTRKAAHQGHEEAKKNLGY